MHKEERALRINQIRCGIAIFFCLAMFVLVFFGVILHIFMEPDEFLLEVGAQSFRMFTVQSNMLVAFAAVLCIPFEIDGLRNRNYHLPRWIVVCMYVGVTCVTLTFFVAVCILSPFTGFKHIMLHQSNLFLHTLCPVFSIILFLFVNTDHNIKLRHSFIALAPVLLYGIIYVIMAFVIGEDKGGWRDHYKFNQFIPWYFTYVILMLFVFGLSNLLRIGHNKMHSKRKKEVIWAYQNSPKYNKPTIEEAVIALAKDQKSHDLGGDVIVPRRIIKMFEEKYHSGKSVTELGQIYLEEYLTT